MFPISLFAVVPAFFSFFAACRIYLSGSAGPAGILHPAAGAEVVVRDLSECAILILLLVAHLIGV